jgi:hypothetical protein
VAVVAVLLDDEERQAKLDFVDTVSLDMREVWETERERAMASKDAFLVCEGARLGIAGGWVGEWASAGVASSSCGGVDAGAKWEMGAETAGATTGARSGARTGTAAGTGAV